MSDSKARVVSGHYIGEHDLSIDSLEPVQFRVGEAVAVTMNDSLKNKIINSNQRNAKRKISIKDIHTTSSIKKVFVKPNVTVPVVHSSSDLPIAALKAQLVESVKSFPTTIVVGETGSGKSTQLVQYLADEFHSKGQSGCIVCTQPRRVAAVTIAQRVASERGCSVGDEVGYSIRFEDRTSHRTRIKFVTGESSCFRLKCTLQVE